MSFWIVALLCCGVAVVASIWPLALTRRAASTRAAYDARVFRDQLLEVDRDLSRNVLNEEQARAAKIEISRRLLAADEESRRHADHAPAPRWVSLALVAVIAVAAPLGTYGIYMAIGDPGLPDQPVVARAAGARPSQVAAEARVVAPPPVTTDAETAGLIEQLEERTNIPDPEPRGLFLLGRSYSQVGRYADAWRAFDRLAQQEGNATPAAVFAAMAEAMILSADGYVSPEAEAALERALAREPDNPIARYYMAVAHVQLNRPELALDLWSGVLRDSPADAPWVPATLARIEAVVAETGLPMPEVAPRPMPDVDEQRRMMASLVTRFEERLMREGGTVDEWIQLVRSYESLGAMSAARRARDTALSAFGDDAEAREAFETALATPPMEEGHRNDALRETVAALDARLAAEGGDAGAWLRLVSSWRALGEDDAADVAVTRARENLADRPAQLAALEGGLGNAPTPGLRPPSEEAVAAAAEMPPEDRMAMIEGMVEGLRDRLYDDGGAPEDWARLISSLGVLGDVEGAAEAYSRATSEHADDRTALAFFRETALLAGVSFE
jgi:cytochrome c-type biogenesis protein CcmH